jgi:DNA-binding MarR family transcriptional regulator
VAEDAARRQELIEETLGLFRRVTGVAVNRFAAAEGPRPLPFLQHFALHYALRSGGATQGELARFLGVTPGHVTGLVDRLIRRIRDAADRRRIHLEATHRAHRFHHRVHANMTAEFVLPMFEGWSESDIRALRAMLLRLLNAGPSGPKPPETGGRAEAAPVRRRSSRASPG